MVNWAFKLRSYINIHAIVSSIIEQLRGIPGLGEYIDAWLLQNEFQQYIQSVIEQWIAANNGKTITGKMFTLDMMDMMESVLHVN